MEDKQAINGQEQDNCQNSHNKHRPLAYHIVLELLAGERLNKHPNDLANQNQQINGETNKEPKEVLVVPRPYTVVQVLTMVIKVLCTPIAPHAVVALYEHEFVTDYTFFYLLSLLLLLFHFARNQGVDRVLDSQIDIVVDNHEH